MKTIQILRTFINILFHTLIAVLVIYLFFFIILIFFPDLLPNSLRNFSMRFNQPFGFRMYIAPISSAVNFVLLIISIFFLRKSMTSFLRSDFYNEIVTSNLKKAGNVFLFIGISSSLVQLFTVSYIQSVSYNMVQLETGFFIRLLNLTIATLDFKSILAIIIGLFFLMFSKIFENSRILKQENDLTI